MESIPVQFGILDLILAGLLLLFTLRGLARGWCRSWAALHHWYSP